MSDEAVAAGSAPPPPPPPPPPAPPRQTRNTPSTASRANSPPTRSLPAGVDANQTADGQAGSTTIGPSRRRRLFDTGVLVATLALLFSAVTYLVERRGQERADERQARAELTETIRRMSELPRVYLDLLKGEDDPNVTETAYSIQISELQTLAAQAERIRSAYPDIVEPADLYAIGSAHFNLEDLGRARAMLESTEELALAEDDALVTTAARRSLAWTHFGLGQLDEGRSAFSRALSMEGLSSVPDSVAIGNEIRTRQFWVAAEVQVGACLEAIDQFGELERVSPEWKSPVLAGDTAIDPTEQLRSAVEQCQ